MCLSVISVAGHIYIYICGIYVCSCVHVHDGNTPSALLLIEPVGMELWQPYLSWVLDLAQCIFLQCIILYF